MSGEYSPPCSSPFALRPLPSLCVLIWFGRLIWASEFWPKRDKSEQSQASKKPTRSSGQDCNCTPETVFGAPLWLRRANWATKADLEPKECKEAQRAEAKHAHH